MMNNLNQNVVNMMINQAMQSNPNLGQNPRALEIIDVLRNHDSARGQELAGNLLNSYNMPQQQGVQMAKNFFGVH